MQVLVSNGVVAKKVQKNFFVPEPLVKEFDRLTDRYGPKRQWMLAAVAILRLLELDERELADYMAKVGAADLNGGDDGPEGFTNLMAELKPKPKPTPTQMRTAAMTPPGMGKKKPSAG